MTAIFILDDQIVARHGLKQILREEFRDLRFAESSSETEALEAFDKRQWDLVVLEVRLFGRDALQVIGDLRRKQPQCKIVILTDRGSAPLASLMVQAGASAYLSKTSSRQELVRAFNQVLNGKTYVGRDVHPVLMMPISALMPAKKLSARERSVLAAVTSGKGSGEIAAEFKLSVQTVSTYRRRIREKLGLRSTADMVRYAIEQRIPSNGRAVVAAASETSNGTHLP